MPSPFRVSRRGFLGAGASAIAAGAVPGMPWFGPTRAWAADAAPFQLSWIKSMQYGGYFAGVDQGIFKKYGIEPVFNSGGPNIDPIASVASGQSVMGDRPIGSLLIARDKGIPIKVIGTVFAKSPFCIISMANKPIRSIKELEGKTMPVATSTRPLILYLLKSAGVDPKSVTFLPSSPDPSGLMTGQYDAISGYSTNQGVLLQSKGADLFMLNVQDLGIPETTGTIYAREDFLEKNRDLVTRYLKAASESWRWALDHPEETTRLMMEKYGVPGLDYKASITELKDSGPFIEAGPKGPSKLLALDLSLYAKIIDIYRKVEMIKTDMKVADVCDDSFINAALAS
jgi:ABC-type nitrate/sulfonate/bicarbonate transport system substrate-binding protein